MTGQGRHAHCSRRSGLGQGIAVEPRPAKGQDGKSVALAATFTPPVIGRAKMMAVSEHEIFCGQVAATDIQQGDLITVTGVDDH